MKARGRPVAVWCRRQRITSLFLCASLAWTAPACHSDRRSAEEKPSSPGGTPAETNDDPAAAPKARAELDLEAYWTAALDGQEAKVQGALRAGVEVDTPDVEGRTALMLAAFNGHANVVRLLLDAGASVERRDHVGRTPLMFASTGPFLEVVRLLLDRGAEVNAVDEGEAWTPLMFAAAEGHEPVVRELLRRGADPSRVDVDGDTALSFARQRGQVGVVEILEEALSK